MRTIAFLPGQVEEWILHASDCSFSSLDSPADIPILLKDVGDWLCQSKQTFESLKS